MKYLKESLIDQTYLPDPRYKSFQKKIIEIL